MSADQQAPRAKHGLGCLKDRYDPRDYKFSAHPARLAALPPSADLRPFCGPMKDQKNQGSCTGHAVSSALELLLNKQSNGREGTVLSPSFVYYEERKREHSTRNCDAGAYPRDGMRVLQKLGCCPEHDDPYTDQRCKAPSRAALQDATAYTIASYHRCTTVDDVKAALAMGLPVVLGVDVFASFEGNAATTTGKIPMPLPGEALLGGHCILAVGYRDDLAQITFQNSWGTSWGDQGFGTFDYSYIADAQLCSDRWAGSL